MLVGEKTAFFFASSSCGSASSPRNRSNPKALIDAAAVLAAAAPAGARATLEMARPGPEVGRGVGVGTGVGGELGVSVGRGVEVATMTTGVAGGVGSVPAWESPRAAGTRSRQDAPSDRGWRRPPQGARSSGARARSLAGVRCCPP